MSDSALQVVSWGKFQRLFRWSQGEHVSLIGSTGSGKTVLARHLLPRRRYVTALATKPRDKSMDELIATGYRFESEWPWSDLYEKVVLWPRIAEMSDMYSQSATFREALHGMYRRGSYCIYADELRYLTDDLGLAKEFSLLWQQGRSNKLSIVAAMQRPRHVPLLAYSQATHLFFWRVSDNYDVKRISDIGGVDTRTIQRTVTRLAGPPQAGFDRSQCCAFLYVNTRSGKLIVSRVEL